MHDFDVIFAIQLDNKVHNPFSNREISRYCECKEIFI